MAVAANKGLGKEAARQLADRGATVVLGSRDPERGAAAAREVGAVPARIDVTDAGSVADVAAWLADEYGRLDVLVNNAGTVVDRRAFARSDALSHIKINSATPGYTATDMTHHRGTRTVTEGARVIVALSTLPDDGPTGGFFNDAGAVPW